MPFHDRGDVAGLLQLVSAEVIETSAVQDEILGQSGSPPYPDPQLVSRGKSA